MQTRYLSLLKFLFEKEQWVTASVLSANLEISVRTVKSYIADLNNFYPGIIPSSSMGYHIVPEIAKQVIEKEVKTEIPQTSGAVSYTHLKGGGAVLAQHETGHVLGIHAAEVAQHFIETGGIKQSACTEDLIGRIVEFLLGNVGQDVQRIGYYNDDSLPGVRCV